MSKPMKKTGKRLLIVLAILALLAGCFGAVAVYAKKEIEKPKFHLPETEPLPSVTALPTEKEALVAYVSRLYEEAVASDEAEGAWRTDVDLGGEMTLPFAADDNAVVSLIRDGAAGSISAFYPSASGVKMSTAEDAPALALAAAAVTDFTAAQGKVNDEGEAYDEDCYFVDLTLDPAAADVTAITVGDAYKGAMEALSAAVKTAEVSAEAETYEMHFRIDRVRDRLLSVEIRTELRLTVEAELTEAYAPLLESGTRMTARLPYATTAHVDFSWYGAAFTERAIAARAGDMTALPADVKVNGEATKEDYVLTFTSTDPEAITIDEDGVMTVHKAPEETVTVTMTLEYGGHTYTDDLTVYITELEVASDVGA